MFLIWNDLFAQNSMSYVIINVQFIINVIYIRIRTSLFILNQAKENNYQRHFSRWFWQEQEIDSFDYAFVIAEDNDARERIMFELQLNWKSSACSAIRHFNLLEQIQNNVRRLSGKFIYHIPVQLLRLRKNGIVRPSIILTWRLLT
jgi:hypothetical protein